MRLCVHPSCAGANPLETSSAPPHRACFSDSGDYGDVGDVGDSAYIPNTLPNSTTSISSGHSFQLCRQHTIASHFFGSCPCSRKFLLSYSNSILTSCHLPGATCRLPRPSGSPRVHSDSTWNPRSHATSANRNTTPISFTGALVSGCRANGGPINGRSL